MERQTLDAYYLADPAFAGWSAEDLLKWAQRRDPEAMPEPLVGAPVVYRFQRLSRTVMYDYVEKAASEKERYERAFAAGIVQIVSDRFGAKGWRPVGRDEAGFVAAPPAELDEADIALAETWDVGQWIYTRSVLGKGSAPILPALPSSLLAWDALEHPSAEPSQE